METTTADTRAAVTTDGPAAAGPDRGAYPTDAAPTTQVLFGDSHCGGFVVCDGFEGTAIDATLWKPPGGGAEVTQTRPARGKSSLELTYDGKNYPELVLKTFPPELKTHMFGRMFLWSQDPAPTYGNQGFFAHVELFRATRYQEYIGYALGIVGDLRLTSPSDDAVSVHGLEINKWQCLEWEFDSVAHTVKAWWNDGTKEVAVDNSKRTLDRWAFGKGQTNFDTIQLGIIPVTSGARPLHVWIDEIALDTQRIGCNR